VPFLRPDESEPPFGVSTEADETVALRRRVEVVLLGEWVVRLYVSLCRVEPEMGGVVSTCPAVRGRLDVVRFLPSSVIFSSAARMRSSSDIPTGERACATSSSSSIDRSLLLLLSDCRVRLAGRLGSTGRDGER
jgi:hypothetical protein